MPIKLELILHGTQSSRDLQGGLTSSGTASTVNVPVKAPREAVVYSRPMACAVYPPADIQLMLRPRCTAAASLKSEKQGVTAELAGGTWMPERRSCPVI